VNEQASNKPEKWFWIVSGVAFAWNIMGAVQYFILVTMTDTAIAELPVAEQALLTDIPIWATSAFAIAVFGGLLGCAGLLMRKKWARPLFIASLVGVVVQMFNWLVLSDTVDVYGAGSIVMPVVVIAIAGFLIWFAGTSTSKGWLS